MRYSFFSIILFVSTVVFSQNTSVDPFKKLQGFSHPESVVFDEEMQVYYVSNMADKEEKDGFISKVSSTGKILDPMWIKELNDPKGLLVHKNKIFVTDITFLVEMDRQTGKILKRIPIDNAISLNDITVDSEGNIFISDLVGNSIYKMDLSGDISQWLQSTELERPNGLLISGKDLFVASWGKEKPGNLLKVDLETKEIQKVTTAGIGNLDGIQQITPDSFYVSDWGTGMIYRINKEGSMEEVVETSKSSGDILYVKDSGEIVIPMNHQNELWWYPAN